MTPGTLSRQYAKLCDLRDFADSEVRQAYEEIAPGRSAGGNIERKLWEYAMLALFLRDVGALREDAQILAVAAGSEEPLFWLTNRAGRIVATDIYGSGGFAYREARSDMLEDPDRFAPYPYRSERLEVRYMDARSLDFPDGSFDAVFSLSSIEHFGGPQDIMAAAAEIGRVLRPGGHAFIVTECLIRWHPLDSPLFHTAVRLATRGKRAAQATPRRRAIDCFRPRELSSRIVGPSGLELMQPLDLRLSAETFENVTQLLPDGTLRPKTGERSPHILLRAFGAPWTSVCLPLRKRNSG